MLENFLNTDWIEVYDVVIRSLLSLITLFLITKLLGKKQVSQLSLFDYVIGISIGNFAAEMTINIESQYMNGIAAVLVFGLVAYFVSIVTMKSIVLRRYFMGVPTILIQHGELIEKNLKKVKFDMNDLLEQCRTNGYFDISEIEYAIMECNGTLSILPKGEYKPVTMKDMQLKAQPQGLCANVIIDGKIMKKNLYNINKDEEWLKQQLKVKGFKKPDHIMLATVDNNEKLTIYHKHKEIQSKDVLE
ncbi:MAG TPA: DUF421 domain-containing protein [Candidatus Fimihabitans intestinipullorum]|uniref:DUF421 domain-containing protein n=1 Tax=Candidatus Fimihabitans intestinipullorum TaxID=2840820 RepID=A0A9D1L2V7_9BACT|nr:DUF421 domain-containing protein [Candidatus Fimihabitans intestinipullorum]